MLVLGRNIWGTEKILRPSILEQLAWQVTLYQKRVAKRSKLVFRILRSHCCRKLSDFEKFAIRVRVPFISWWRHQMETFSASLALCAGNSPVPVNSPHKGQWRGALIFFFDLRLNKRLSKQPRGWWFEMPSWSLWRQCNVMTVTSQWAPCRHLDCLPSRLFRRTS